MASAEKATSELYEVRRGNSSVRMAEARKGIRWMAWHEGADEGRRSLRKVSGRWQATYDPRISEWGNPA